MKIEYEVTIKGYLPVVRSLMCYVKPNKLSFSDIGAYMCFVFQADFDKRHKKLYGAIIRDDDKIADLLGYSKTTVYKQKKKLVAKGLLTKKGDVYYITNYELFKPHLTNSIIKLKEDILKRIFENPKLDIEKFLFEHSEEITTTTKTVSKDFNISFNGSLGLFNEVTSVPDGQTLDLSTPKDIDNFLEDYFKKDPLLSP